MFLVFPYGIIGYKKLTSEAGYSYLCKLYIKPNTPIYCRFFSKEALAKYTNYCGGRNSAGRYLTTQAKLRVPEAEVLVIVKLGGRTGSVDSLKHYSIYAPRDYKLTNYRVGETVVAPNWDDRNVLAASISFWTGPRR